MDRHRRYFLGLLGLGALAMSGCRPETAGAEWQVVNRPTSGGTPPPRGAQNSGLVGIGEDHPRTPYRGIDMAQFDLPKAGAAIEILDHAYGREVWADAQPIAERLNPMTTPTRITMHHTGEKSLSVVKDDIIEELRHFRRHHVKAFNAGDIGYHYLIDRNGQLWIGREMKYQGAHVKDQNQGNIGVVALGNFEEQDPTAAQLQTIQLVMPALMKRYNIGVHQIRTHQEMAPTLCPGRNLQGRFSDMRDRHFA